MPIALYTIIKNCNLIEILTLNVHTHSFAIILQECQTRNGAWGSSYQDPEVIIDRVRKSSNPPFRPTVPHLLDGAEGKKSTTTLFPWKFLKSILRIFTRSWKWSRIKVIIAIWIYTLFVLLTIWLLNRKLEILAKNAYNTGIQVLTLHIKMAELLNITGIPLVEVSWFVFIQATFEMNLEMLCLKVLILSC